jgi:hypothetical protein|tara:strand:- start:2569 stop:3903 length:1335 start_codon:yes stop_codon:yes gene_type:complete
MLTKKWFMVVLGLLSFGVVAFSPIYLSFTEVSAVDGELLDESAETQLYIDSGRNLAFIEQAIAKVNGIDGYEGAKESVHIKFDIEKIKNIDLEQKTIYISGKVSGTWIPNSIAEVSIAPPGEYNTLRLSGYQEEDIMKDMVFPDMIQDDYFSYERILFNKLKGKSGEVYASEYRFSGNLNFAPDLQNFPFDYQKIELAIKHKVLPSYMIKLKALRPTINIGRIQDFLVGSYKVIPPSRLPSYVRLPYEPMLEGFFGQKSEDFSDQLMAKRLEGVESSILRSMDKTSETSPSDLVQIKKMYFSADAGPHSISAISIPISRQVSSTWLKSIFPVALSLLALVIASYIPANLSEVRLAIPPTILLSLVFMQQTSHDGLPELAFPILLDYFYLLAFVATIVMFFETILLSSPGISQGLKDRFQWFARVFTLFSAAFGMPMVWVLSRLF